MNRRGGVFWLLLIVAPAVTMGVLALYLLRHEEQRLAGIAERVALDQARTLSGIIELEVRNVEDSLLRKLEQVATDPSLTELRRWAESDPLVRNVAVIGSGSVLIHPAPDDPLSEEERAFVARFRLLFDGQVPWQRDLEEGGRPLRAAAANSRDTSSTGWVPWFSGNQLHLLGWVLQPATRRRFVAELNVPALWSRILPALPPRNGDAQRIAVLDGNGNLLYQSGDVSDRAAKQPMVTVPLGVVLPHWQIAVFAKDAPAARGFLWLAALFVALVVSAIVVGAWLLLRQSEHDRLQAERKTTFVSNVSHELKTPLTTIRMYSEMLREGRVHDERKRQGYLDVIVSESQRLTRLVNNVLDFSRLEQGRKRYESEPVDLKEVVRDVLDTQAVRLQASEMQLRATLPDEPAWANLDRDSFEQVVLNLIDNALKYAHGGKQLTIELVRFEKGWRLLVSDRGAGVQTSPRERIFESFVRGDESLTTRQPGAGLGLSIARRLMRDQGGDVRYEPREGGGATFVVEISGEVSA